MNFVYQYDYIRPKLNRVKFYLTQEIFPIKKVPDCFSFDMYVYHSLYHTEEIAIADNRKVLEM